MAYKILIYFSLVASYNTSWFEGPLAEKMIQKSGPKVYNVSQQGIITRED